MKKTFTTILMALLLCVCMVFGLTACGGFTQDDIDNAVNDATATLNEQITALEADIAEKAAKIATLETEKAALISEKVALEAEIAALETSNGTLTAEKAALIARVSELEASIAEKDTEIAELEAEKQSLTDRVAELEAENKKLEEEKNELEAENEALKNCVKGNHTYTDNGDGTHNLVCQNCDYVGTTTIESHTVEKWVDNGDGTHSLGCQYCDYIDTTTTEEHRNYIDDNCKCNVCGAEHYLRHADIGNCMCHYCYEDIHDLDENCVCTICSWVLHNINSTTGICLGCNTYTVTASITVDGVKNYYATIEEAVADANGKDGIVIVVENDYCVRDPDIKFDSGNITLDLNGKTLDSVIGYSVPINGATVTIRDSVGGGKTLETVGGWSGTLIIESGKHAHVSSPGNLVILGGEFTNVSASTGGTVVISGGSFERIAIYKDGGTFADILADGYCFYDENGNVVDISTIQTDEHGWYYLEDVTVGEINK